MSSVSPFLMASGFHPDVAFSFVFSELAEGVQTGRVYFVMGSRPASRNRPGRFSCNRHS
jgi:hypothetical protein